ncbi:MAG: efflux RND transporter periplasmic adaptor subunit [Burkholderiales bacterium]
MLSKAQWSKIRSHRIALLVALMVLLLAAFFGPALVLGQRVATLKVTQRDFVRTVVASGRVQAPHRVDIGVQIVGTVAEVPVAEGQTVAANQTLVVLDSRELRASAAQADVAVAQAQARLRQLTELQVPVAVQSLRQAQVNLDNARAQLQRQQNLFEQGFIGQAALDDARKGVDLADSQVRSASEQLRTLRPSGSDFALAQTTLEQARANAEAARARLAYATVRAPSAGVLINRDVEPGDVVQPGKALMVLSPSGDTELVVQIDEKNLGLLALGQHALASADAFADQRFAAELVYINPGVDAQRGSVEVKLRVASPPPYLRQDMTVSVDIEVARRAQALLVPSDAVRDADSGSPWVLVVEDGRARRRPVVLGLRGNGVAEALQGLQPDDEVVPVTAAAVGDGTRVRTASSP